MLKYGQRYRTFAMTWITFKPKLINQRLILENQ